MTRERLDEIDREELIDLVLDAHAIAEAEKEKREKAEQQLAWFKRQLFGQKSERRHVFGPAEQLTLGEALEPKPKPAASTKIKEHERRKKPREARPSDGGGLRFDETVPVERIDVPNPAIRGLAPEEYSVIGEKTTRRLAQRSSYVVLEFVRPVVKLKDADTISCPPAPAAVLEKSFADVSLLAGLLVDKGRFHLPLYRQHQRMQAAGIRVSRGSLTNWVSRAIDLLEPIYVALLASVLSSAVLAIDETPIRAGRKVRGKMRTGYFWPMYGDRDEVVFPYAASRARSHLDDVLSGFVGTMLSDGYAAYERFAAGRDAVVHALCWSHTRRAFEKAKDVEPERTEEALARIAALYRNEEAIADQGLEGGEKLRARAEHSKAVVGNFFAWILEELEGSALLPSNLFTQAAHYALNRRTGLEVFLSNADVPLDTNHLERALRPIPMGKKNWLFCWTEVGAERLGRLQSLLVTCVLHGVDPTTYLIDVLQRIDHHPSDRVHELSPREWKQHFAENPIRSHLHRKLSNDASG